MLKDFTICVGTVGSAIWRSPDGGVSWHRIRGEPFPGPFGVPMESPIRALAVDPGNPEHIMAASELGIFSSEDKGASWKRLDALHSPLDGLQVWSMAIDPVEPNIVFIGTKPAAVFRSRDGGVRWKKLSVEISEWCEDVGPPRVTAIIVDPQDHRTVWIGMEAEGVRLSRDGGNTWRRVADELMPEELPTGPGVAPDDIHDMTLSTGEPKTVYFSTPREVFASKDTGESWQSVFKTEKLPLDYCRPLAVKADDPNVIFLGQGDTLMGVTGGIQRSKDGGKSWESLPMSVEPNSCILCFATHPSDPDLIMAGTAYGQLFATTNGGDFWEKLRMECGEIRALAWMPN